MKAGDFSSSSTFSFLLFPPTGARTKTSRQNLQKTTRMASPALPRLLSPPPVVLVPPSLVIDEPEVFDCTRLLPQISFFHTPPPPLTAPQHGVKIFFRFRFPDFCFKKPFPPFLFQTMTTTAATRTSLTMMTIWTTRIRMKRSWKELLLRRSRPHSSSSSSNPPRSPWCRSSPTSTGARRCSSSSSSNRSSSRCRAGSSSKPPAGRTQQLKSRCADCKVKIFLCLFLYCFCSTK